MRGRVDQTAQTAILPARGNGQEGLALECFTGFGKNAFDDFRFDGHENNFAVFNHFLHRTGFRHTAFLVQFIQLERIGVIGDSFFTLQKA